MIENVLLFFYLLFFCPRWAWDRIRGKKRPSLFSKLGYVLPETDLPLIWIHAVSVGEVKAAKPFFEKLERLPYFFYVTTTTSTGQEEARRSLSSAHAFGFLPFDFTWIVKRVIRRLKPKHFILVETDFWPNLLFELKKHGTQVSLISGKLSERSYRRFQMAKKFSSVLFSQFDDLCVQNEEYYQRFASFVPFKKLHLTGNLKLDFKKEVCLESLDLEDPVITVSCTHDPEEELLVDLLKGGKWTLLLAPRHPERFAQVAQLLRKKGLVFSRWSASRQGKLILVDEMGKLPLCYSHSRLAILGGSFVPHIGGHNVLEPCLYEVPVFFGPYMEQQKEFVKRVLDHEAGSQVSLSTLKENVEAFFQTPSLEKRMKAGARRVIEEGRGSSEKTWKILQNKKSFF